MLSETSLTIDAFSMESTRGGTLWEAITDLHTLSSHTPVDIGWEGDN